MNTSLSGYDLIGDIHGHAEELKLILQKMDYRLKDHVWYHPERKAIFVGDYIDRGGEIRETLYIVKNMCDAGTALAIMGNHEYNAIAFNYHHPSGGHIREHSIKNLLQHYATIKQFQGYEKEWDDYLAWFANLPLFLEIDGIRVIHACWDDNNIEELKKQEGPLSKEILIKSHQKNDPLFKPYEETLKGKEVELPDGKFFIDKDGNERRETRTRWWMNTSEISLFDYVFAAPDSVKEYQVPLDLANDGYLSSPPVFFGHYWLDGNAETVLQAQNVCCLDYSVAKEGKLVAYRYDIGATLTDSNFITIKSRY